MDGWNVRSNAESGDGYSDISIEIEDQETGIVIELKYAENASFDTACREARDEWEVLKEVSQQFADLGNGYLILLDENYIPFGKKETAKVP